jgi:hypothetical protein
MRLGRARGGICRHEVLLSEREDVVLVGLRLDASVLRLAGERRCGAPPQTGRG